tara:strand:- start:590 stop:865 length:276 start_codon:yes stop_codon:yes gene_type:complete
MHSDLRVEIAIGRLSGWGAQAGAAGTVKRWLSLASQSGGRIISDGEDIDYNTALTKYSSSLDNDIQDTIYLDVLSQNQGESQFFEFVLLKD